MTAAELNAIQTCLRYVRNKCSSSFSSLHDMRVAFAALPLAERAVAAALAFPDRLEPTFDAAGENPPGFIAHPTAGGTTNHAISVREAVPGVRGVSLRTLCGEAWPEALDPGEITCIPCLRVFFKDHKIEHLSAELRAKLYPLALRCPNCAGLLMWTEWPEYVQACPHGCGQGLPPCKVPGCINAGCIGFTPGKRVCEDHRSMLVETP